MPRPQTDPLRRLTRAERRELGRPRRSRAAPAAEVTRATLILLVSDRYRYQDAARAAGGPSGDAVAHLVARFNREGLATVTPGTPAGGPRPTIRPPGSASCGRSLAPRPRRPTGPPPGHCRPPRRALRSEPDGLPRVSAYTIWWALREAGYSFQRTRTWCPTGRAVRKRKSGRVTVTDPDAGAKKG